MRDYDTALGTSCIKELNNTNFPHLKHLDLRGSHLKLAQAELIFSSLHNLNGLHLSSNGFSLHLLLSLLCC